MLNLTRLTVATLIIAGGASSPAAAGGDFWGWGRTYAPPPVHVYDFTRGPTWTSNGWSYPAVQVYYPAPLPPPVYAAPACGVGCRGDGYNHRPRSWDRRRGW